MDGVVDTGSELDQQVYVIGISENAELDSAILRQGRLGLHVEVPLVDTAEIREIYERLSGISTSGVLADREEFEERLEGVRGAVPGCDVAGLFIAASE